MVDFVGIREFPWSFMSGEAQPVDLNGLLREPDNWHPFDAYVTLDIPATMILRGGSNEGEPDLRGAYYKDGDLVYGNFSLPVPNLRHKEFSFKLKVSRNQPGFASRELNFGPESISLSGLKNLCGKEDLYDDDFYFLRQWSNFFDTLYDVQCAGNLRFSMLADEIRKFSGGNQDAQMSLIVTISELFTTRLQHLVNSMRTALARERRVMPLERASEMDAKCIQWLFNQPGRSIRDKIASNNCQVMAIARYQNRNLLENRVLKEFLFRSKKEALLYIKRFQATEHSKLLLSKRVRSVSSFKSLCNDLLQVPEFEGVARQLTLPTPNYVLLNDSRYKKVWKYFVKLLKQEQEKDRRWAYQKRTFEDVAFLLLQASLCELCTKQVSASWSLRALADSLPLIESEQVRGRRTDPASVAGPFHLRSISGNRHFLIELIGNLNLKGNDNREIYPELQGLAASGTGNFVTIQDLAHNRVVVVSIYALHCPYSTDELYGPDDLLLSAENAYRRANISLVMNDTLGKGTVYEHWAIILRSSLGDSVSPLIKRGSCYYLEMPVEPHLWTHTLEELGKLWQSLLGEIIS